MRWSGRAKPNHPSSPLRLAATLSLARKLLPSPLSREEYVASRIRFLRLLKHPFPLGNFCSNFLNEVMRPYGLFSPHIVKIVENRPAILLLHLHALLMKYPFKRCGEGYQMGWAGSIALRGDVWRYASMRPWSAKRISQRRRAVRVAIGEESLELRQHRHHRASNAKRLGRRGLRGVDLVISDA
jgi:hypothetical protein